MKPRSIELSLDQAKEWVKKYPELRESIPYTDEELLSSSSWEKYKEDHLIEGKFVYSITHKRVDPIDGKRNVCDNDVFAVADTKEELLSHIALKKLLFIRNAKRDGWVNDKDISKTKYSVSFFGGKWGTRALTSGNDLFTFRTLLQAQEFLSENLSLLNELEDIY